MSKETISDRLDKLEDKVTKTEDKLKHVDTKEQLSGNIAHTNHRKMASSIGAAMELAKDPQALNDWARMNLVQIGAGAERGSSAAVSALNALLNLPERPNSNDGLPIPERQIIQIAANILRKNGWVLEAPPAELPPTHHRSLHDYLVD